MPKYFSYNILKCWKKYGNKISNLKTRFRALCSEWWIQWFFYISTPGFQKWTFINVQFWKSSFRFEKKKHHHLFGVRPPNSAGLPLCFGYVFLDLRYWLHYAAVYISAFRVPKMVGKFGNPFWGILGCVFLGDILKKVAEV